MTEVKMVQREMFLDHRNQMMILMKQVDDYTTGRMVVVPELSTPHPTNLEDSSTEGDKRVKEQEKATQVGASNQEEAGGGDKGKRKLSEAFETTEGIGGDGGLEEGELLVDDFVPVQDEPYVPYFVENIHRNEEELEVEDTEFIDEHVYDDDCLGVKEGKIKNLEKQLAEIEERKRRAEERSE